MRRSLRGRGLPTRGPLPGVLLAALLSVLLTVLLTGGCAAVPAPTPTVTPTATADGGQRIEITVAGGAVRGGPVRYAVSRNAAVQLVVFSDVADQVHVHGYDRFSYVTAGASTTIAFVADLPGVFDVELERRGLPLGQLQVD